MLSIQSSPRVNQLLQCGLFSLQEYFCCDLPHTYNMCCCCELFNTYWKPNRAMSADLSFFAFYLSIFSFLSTGMFGNFSIFLDERLI